MKLTVNKQLIQMPVDAKISIERNSPVLNEKTGTFSYPFPVPTLPNEKALGYPGRLQRVGYLSSKEFVLEDGGLQILRGEIDFDEDITREETGIILGSGNLIFSEQMEHKRLGDFDYGSEPFPYTPRNATDQEKIDGENPIVMVMNWRTKTAANGDFVLAPFWGSFQGTDVVINQVNSDGLLSLNYYPALPLQTVFCLQFKFDFIIRKIFEGAGYTIIENEFETSEFIDAVLFGKLMPVKYWLYQGTGMPEPEARLYYPEIDTLYYADLMPDLNVLDFMAMIKEMFCLAIDIDERRKQVSIFFRKGIFEPENVEQLGKCELAGWKHSEKRTPEGFKLFYQDQDDSFDTRGDYTISETMADYASLPAVSENYYELVVHVTDIDRDYILTDADGGDYEWRRIGRLKPYMEGEGEKEFELKVNIPANEKRLIQELSLELEAPVVPVSIAAYTEHFLEYGTYVSLFRGSLALAGGAVFPYINNDRFLLDGSVDYQSTLTPTYLYDNYYADFVNWQTYHARGASKLLKLPLIKVINLQFRKRYVINGIPILLNKINFELPHKGVVKVEAFTAPAREEEIDFGPLPPNLIM